MGDRVLLQVVAADGEEFGPVVYGHWSGSGAGNICRRLAKRMNNRRDDVAYWSARLVQEVCNGDTGALSVGCWNAEKVLTESYSHGDAGVVLIRLRKQSEGAPATFQCLGGYLSIGPDGYPTE